MCKCLRLITVIKVILNINQLEIEIEARIAFSTDGFDKQAEKKD